MLRFEFVTSSRIIFGSGTLGEIGALAADMGKRAFVVIGRTKERALPLLNILGSAGVEGVLFQVDGEPTTTGFKVLDLTAYGLKQKDLPLLIEKASISSSMQGNPVKLRSSEIEEIIILSLGKEIG